MTNHHPTTQEMQKRLRTVEELNALDVHRQSIDAKAMPPRVTLPDADTFVVTDIINELTASASEERERVYREAIQKTDWSKTAVLRIIELYPIPAVESWSDRDGLTERFAVSGPEITVERYDDRAPSPENHGDGERRHSVTTVTKPLLERLGDKDDRVRALFKDTDQEGDDGN